LPFGLVVQTLFAVDAEDAPPDSLRHPQRGIAGRIELVRLRPIHPQQQVDDEIVRAAQVAADVVVARSQRLFSRSSWKMRCQDSLSATMTMPRKIRRLVGVLKIVGLNTRSSSPSEREWSIRISSRARRATSVPRWVSKRLSQYEWPSDDVLDVTASWRGTK